MSFLRTKIHRLKSFYHFMFQLGSTTTLTTFHIKSCPNIFVLKTIDVIFKHPAIYYQVMALGIVFLGVEHISRSLRHTTLQSLLKLN